MLGNKQCNGVTAKHTEQNPLEKPEKHEKNETIMGDLNVPLLEL